MKHLSILLILSLLLVLCSCRREDLPPTFLDPSTGSTSASVDTTVPTTQPTQTIAAATEPTSLTTDPTEQFDLPDWLQDVVFTRFLTDVNHNGQISSDEPLPPGALPPVEAIPAADRSLIGATVQVVFAQEQQTIPFYYAYDAENGLERLAVIVIAQRIPLLMIFETKFAGIDPLCEAIADQDIFEARILSMTNITFEEGAVYAYNACLSTDGIYHGESINIFSPADITEAAECLGLVGISENGVYYNTIKAGVCRPVSQALENDFNVFRRIFERYSLTDIMAPQD